MKTVYKYPIAATGYTKIEGLPEDSIVRSVDLDPMGQPCVWIELDTSKSETIDKVIYGIGTGWSMDKGEFRYIGMLKEGAYIWHIYEKLPDYHPFY